jgi:hypothetical protein
MRGLLANFLVSEAHMAFHVLRVKGECEHEFKHY